MKQNNERYRELIKSDPMNWSGTVWRILQKTVHEWYFKLGKVINDISSAANAFHWQQVVMGISVFFSMIKAIKILNGIKYLEIMKVSLKKIFGGRRFYSRFWNDWKGTYFRAGDDLKNHLIFMVCIFGGFVHASRVLFKETHDFSSPMRATQMVLGFSDWILTFTNYFGHMIAI